MFYIRKKNILFTFNVTFSANSIFFFFFGVFLFEKRCYRLTTNFRYLSSSGTSVHIRFSNVRLVSLFKHNFSFAVILDGAHRSRNARPRTSPPSSSSRYRFPIYLWYAFSAFPQLSTCAVLHNTYYSYELRRSQYERRILKRFFHDGRQKKIFLFRDQIIIVIVIVFIIYCSPFHLQRKSFFRCRRLQIVIFDWRID